MADLRDGDPFFTKYAAAVSAMHALPESDGRNWRRQARIHADSCKHGDLNFLFWHRHYLAFFEGICGQLVGDASFTLPYWNWSKKGGVLPPAFYDLPGLNVETWNDPGQYSTSNWGPIDTVGRRGLRKGQGLLNDPVRGGSFQASAIDGIKRMPTADLFRGRLEGSPHNNGHVVVGATASGKGGHMGSGLSPLDPIFWLHHCMVDRIWAEWQEAGNATPDPAIAYAGEFVTATGATATATTAQAMRTASLGYTYDVLQRPTGPIPPASPTLRSTSLDLDRALRERAAPVALGTATATSASNPLVETAIKVATPGLVGALTGDRAFRELSLGADPSVNVEGRRVLARFTNVVPPEGRRDLIVNVFVNCPYLSPEIGYNDPHYGGTFSFFNAGHQGHGSEFVVDLTSAVRNLSQEGRIRTEELTVQLMPVPAYMEGTSSGTFKAGAVEILVV